jgi:creatinine amidohydrolase
MNDEFQFSKYNEVRYELMRPDQIIKAREKTPVVYIPLGPLEWHGYHLPFGVDMLHAYTIALETAMVTGGVVLPQLPLGSERLLEPDRVKDRGFDENEQIVGMDFPGLSLTSLYIDEDIFLNVVRELIKGLKIQGFRVITIVNGHGGKFHVIGLIKTAIQETEPGKVAVLHAFAADIGPGKGGHAERGETAFMQAFFPDTVKLDALPPLPTPLKNVEHGVLDAPTCEGKPTPDYTVRMEQDPRNANIEEGFEATKSVVSRVSNQIGEALKTWDDPKFPAWSPSRILGFDYEIDPKEVAAYFNLE